MYVSLYPHAYQVSVWRNCSGEVKTVEAKPDDYPKRLHVLGNMPLSMNKAL